MAKGKPVLADVAALAGVSTAAASFALSGKTRGIPQATVDRVWKAAAELGYAKASSAKLRDWTKAACLVDSLELFNANVSFFAGVLGRLQAAAVKNRFELFLFEFNPAAELAERERRIHEMAAVGVEVVLVDRRESVKPLKDRGFKVVLVQNGSLPDCICVRSDDHEVGRLAAVHALANGHLSVGTIFPPGMETHPRLLGFVETVEAGGGECLDKFRWTVPQEHSKAADKIFRQANGRKRLPTLFHCFSDNILQAAIKGFFRAGLKVPSDVSLIGSDNLYWGACSCPAFTTVDLLEGLFAARLIEAIRDAASGERPYSVASPVRLVARETVRKLSK